MRIEQHRRVRSWPDERPASVAWALVAAGVMTAALLLSLGMAERAPQRLVERMPQVIELQPVVVVAVRVPTAVGDGLAALAARPQPALQ